MLFTQKFHQYTDTPLNLPYSTMYSTMRRDAVDRGAVVGALFPGHTLKHHSREWVSLLVSQ